MELNFSKCSIIHTVKIAKFQFNFNYVYIRAFYFGGNFTRRRTDHRNGSCKRSQQTGMRNGMRKQLPNGINIH